MLSRTLSQVLHYRIARIYVTYSWFLSAIVLISAYVILLWPMIWYRTYLSRQITSQHRSFPQLSLLLMASFDCASSVLGIWPLLYLSSSLVNILSCGVLVFTMIGSVWIFKTQYQLLHLAGVLLVIAGLFLRLVPTFANTTS